MLLEFGDYYLGWIGFSITETITNSAFSKSGNTTTPFSLTTILMHVIWPKTERPDKYREGFANGWMPFVA